MADYRQMARRAAVKHGLNPGVFERQIQQESGFAKDVITGSRRSSAGALGIAQIMPATARGWGVNPLNPRAALNAAAANMARYVKQFGSYENALRAYNAGPGAVKASHGFAETNNYVRTILNGHDPGKLGKPRGSTNGGDGAPSLARMATDGTPGTAGARGTPTRVYTTTTPGVDNSAERASLLQSFLSDKDSDIMDFALQTKALADVPETSTRRTVHGFPGVRATPGTPGTRGGGGGSSDGGGGGGAGFGAGHSPLLELIHKGNQAYAVKDGKRVNGPQFYASVWDNHAGHVHVAAGPKTIVALGKIAQKMGLSVGENPHFGGVDPVHVPGSYHYKGEAIDVSGDPRKMNAYARKVERLYGLAR